MSVPALHLRPAWALLKKHHQKIRRTQLRQLFAKDSGELQVTLRSLAPELKPGAAAPLRPTVG